MFLVEEILISLFTGSLLTGMVNLPSKYISLKHFQISSGIKSLFIKAIIIGTLVALVVGVATPYDITNWEWWVAIVGLNTLGILVVDGIES